MNFVVLVLSTHASPPSGRTLVHEAGGVQSCSALSSTNIIFLPNPISGSNEVHSWVTKEVTGGAVLSRIRASE